MIIQGDINAALAANDNNIDETKKAFVAYFEHAAKVPLFFHLHTVPARHPVDKQHVGQANDLDAFAANLCKKYKKCISINLPEQLNAADGAIYYARDGVHLNQAGTALWAERIKSVITAWHPAQR